MNLVEINNTIDTLENGATTFDTCLKLSSLYIVRDKLQTSSMGTIGASDGVVDEYKDILPSYNAYKSTKIRYHNGEVSKEVLVRSLNLLCIEIREFIQTLYSSTTCGQEREIIKNIILGVNNIFD